MTQKKQCPGCGAPVEESWSHCAQCGLELGGGRFEQLTFTDGAGPSPEPITRPTTVAELRQYCAERSMPLEKMRFFIDEDYRQPKAFGIYRDGDRFVVYKNKADGSRAVRYQGPDEAYAVNELYQKLLSECHNRGIYPENFGQPGGMRNRGASDAGTNGSGTRFGGSGRGTMSAKTKAILIAVVAVIAVATLVFSFFSHRNDGYYRRNGGYYYRSGWTWYTVSDMSDGWYHTSVADDFADTADFLGDRYSGDWGITDVRQSDIWESDNDSGSDTWSDWDSGGTDWGSDW